MSPRSVDTRVQSMGMTGISKSQVSRLCEEIDEKVQASLTRPIEGDSQFRRRPSHYEASWRCRLGELHGR